jgi:hypothetical protein
MNPLVTLAVVIGLIALSGALPGEDVCVEATWSDNGRSGARSDGAVKLVQGTVTRIGGHSVGVFYVIERRMKVAVWCDEDEEEGRDLTVEVGGIVEIGGRSFALVRINAAANPPYAILAPRPSPP